MWSGMQATKQRELPAWVTFPDFERVEWVNTMIAQIWPHAASAIVAQVSCHDPTIPQNMHASRSSRQFCKLRLQAFTVVVLEDS